MIRSTVGKGDHTSPTTIDEARILKPFRDMFESFFTPEAVENLLPMMQGTIDTILDTMIQGGCEEPVDFIYKFAEAIPIQVSMIYQHLAFHYSA